MSDKKDKLIWLDLEMTGLDAAKDAILEIAVVITKGNLEVIEIGPSLAIYQPPYLLSGMNAWCQNQHTQSGLIDRVLESSHTTSSAELAVLQFLKKHLQAKESPMCGNSIHADRAFLHKLMPNLHEYFHYRNLDVSSFRESIERWDPQFVPYQKKNNHLALDDILESIEELKFYKQKYFGF